MISPQDLRIGNLIWHTVNNIDTAAMEDVLTTVDGNLIKSLELHPYLGYNPIPLTEEWLEKFGFEIKVWSIIKLSDSLSLSLGKTASKNGLPYHIGIKQTRQEGIGFTIQDAAEIQKQENDFDDEKFMLHKSDTVYIGAINYVHQLQNLIFVLTNKELQLK